MPPHHYSLRFFCGPSLSLHYLYGHFPPYLPPSLSSYVSSFLHIWFCLFSFFFPYSSVGFLGLAEPNKSNAASLSLLKTEVYAIHIFSEPFFFFCWGWSQILPCWSVESATLVTSQLGACLLSSLSLCLYLKLPPNVGVQKSTGVS